jgi:hypothetical protein
MSFAPRLARFGLALGLLHAALPAAALAQTPTPAPSPVQVTAPRLVPHQAFVEDVLRAGELPVDHPRAMFAWVVSQMPERVKVWPTESYWYFSFIHRGVKWAGNIRLDAKDRDEGKVH